MTAEQKFELMFCEKCYQMTNHVENICMKCKPMTAEQEATKMKFSELLIELGACKEAREWALDMPIEEIVAKCHRGDWLLWLARKVNVDKRRLTLAKAYCANTVRHLMKDERSINAVDVAIRYGNGQATDDELNDAADAAAVVAAYAAAYGAADAAYVAADAAADAADAAADAAYVAAYAAAAYDAWNKVRNETADICRKYIGSEIIKKVNELL